MSWGVEISWFSILWRSDSLTRLDCPLPVEGASDAVEEHIWFAQNWGNVQLYKL